MTKLQHMWFCPVCGMSHGSRYVVPKGEPPLEKRYLKYLLYTPEHYLDTIDFEPDKPFGILLRTMGAGKGKAIERYTLPDYDSEAFGKVQRRLLQAVLEWVNKGWLSIEQVQGVLAQTVPGSITPRLPLADPGQPDSNESPKA